MIGILAALIERDRTGRGCQVDTALLDSQVGVLANQALNYLVSGKVPRRIGNAHPNIVPYQVFPVADGHIIIATGNDNQFGKLCAVLGEGEIAQGPRSLANSDRLANRDALIARLSGLTRQWQHADLLGEARSRAGARQGRSTRSTRCLPIRRCVHRGMRIDPPSAAAKAGRIPGVRTPITVDGKPMAAERPAPRLGEHTAEILREIGEIS